MNTNALEGTVRGRLSDLNIQLPLVSAPLASYAPAVRTGNLVFTSGQLPLVDGKLESIGKLGDGISTDLGYELARICALNAVAAVADLLDLDSIVRVVKVVGFVASELGFTGQSGVIDGASDVLGLIFGDQGVHARSAVGVAELPLGSPVEVEIVVEVR
ncbi:RidA family protein [Arthrobacter sp. B2a2-09]|uniref:RidA family protein n=1 Tax=Arthrobacter sp. B2a2-09 TaxID=2952822 RepID=UPI0022CD93CB|nr:RidA family protein [Arthrobacter sp. B2a2-09]MCZ9882263.1 RidA family protein [Arthrobacter sp. B2a2-09]